MGGPRRVALPVDSLDSLHPFHVRSILITEYGEYGARRLTKGIMLVAGEGRAFVHSIRLAPIR